VNCHSCHPRHHGDSDQEDKRLDARFCHCLCRTTRHWDFADKLRLTRQHFLEFHVSRQLSATTSQPCFSFSVCASFALCSHTAMRATYSLHSRIGCPQDKGSRVCNTGSLLFPAGTPKTHPAKNSVRPNGCEEPRFRLRRMETGAVGPSCGG
jgi:hypothetical protein